MLTSFSQKKFTAFTVLPGASGVTVTEMLKIHYLFLFLNIITDTLFTLKNIIMFLDIIFKQVSERFNLIKGSTLIHTAIL